MSKDDIKKEVKGFLASIFPSLPKEIRYVIGGMLVFFLYFLMMYSLIYLPEFMKNLADDSGSPKAQCWELQSIEEKAYKVNTCTGEVLLLESGSER